MPCKYIMNAPRQQPGICGILCMNQNINSSQPTLVSGFKFVGVSCRGPKSLPILYEIADRHNIPNDLLLMNRIAAFVGEDIK
jgi:hypothetical protein